MGEFFRFFWQKWKVLKIAWNGDKIVQKSFQFYLPNSPQTFVSKKIPFMSNKGQAEGIACADLVARTPLDVSRLFCGIFVRAKCVRISTKKSTKRNPQVPRMAQLGCLSSALPNKTWPSKVQPTSLWPTQVKLGLAQEIILSPVILFFNTCLLCLF